MQSLSYLSILSCVFAGSHARLSEGLIQDQKLFVGFGNGSDVAEILNFPSSESQTPCASSIPEYPLGEVWGTVGMVVEGTIVLCGGVYYPSLDWYSECFALVMDNTSGLLEWQEFPSMEKQRGWGSSAMLEDGSWMVLMGEGHYGEMTHTSEIFNISTKSWISGPEFPVAQSGHCAVSINESFILLVGGWSQEDHCFLFNLEDESYQEVACLQSGERIFHSCTKTADGRVAVVGGCLKHEGNFACAEGVDDFFVDLEYFDPLTASWSYGPPLDKGVMGSALVSDGDDLLLLGGLTLDGLVDTMYRMKADKWELLDTKLNAKQMHFPAFPVDASVYNC